METMKDEQPEAAEVRPSEEAAADAAEDSAPGVGEDQPGERKWANLFETPEKLEEAYRHLYRAYHDRSRELKDMRDLVEMLAGAAAQETPAAPQAQAAPDAAGGTELVEGLLQMVAQAQTEAVRARQTGEHVMIAGIESQIRGFYDQHKDLENAKGGLDGFRKEVLELLGRLDANALLKLPGVLEKAYRVATYPAAVREAAQRDEEAREAAKRFAVEGSGTGTMSMPQNRARDKDFRALVERLKREAGI